MISLIHEIRELGRDALLKPGKFECHQHVLSENKIHNCTFRGTMVGILICTLVPKLLFPLFQGYFKATQI